MKTFRAILVTSIQITDINEIERTFEPGTQVVVSITEQPTMSTGLDGISRIDGPGIITGEVGGQLFSLDADDFERTGPIEQVRDPLPVITIHGDRLKVHMRLMPAVLRDAKLSEQLINVVKRMKTNLKAKTVVFDFAHDAFDLTAEDADAAGYVAV